MIMKMTTKGTSVLILGWDTAEDSHSGSSLYIHKYIRESRHHKLFLKLLLTLQDQSKVNSLYSIHGHNIKNYYSYLLHFIRDICYSCMIYQMVVLTWNSKQYYIPFLILKPIWTYGVQLWGSASNSNLEILESFQSKVLHIITDALWYVPNAVMKHNWQVLMVGQKRAKLQRHLPTKAQPSSR
jgi:hypothetical protein